MQTKKKDLKPYQLCPASKKHEKHSSSSVFASFRKVERMFSFLTLRANFYTSKYFFHSRMFEEKNMSPSSKPFYFGSDK